MNYEALVRQIAKHEGFVPYPYKDSLGWETIGYGWLIDKRKGGLSQERAYRWLASDLVVLTGELRRAIPWMRSLGDVRERVLVDMAWNLGITGLLRFRATLAAVKAGDWEGARIGMLRSKWAKQVGQRARTLARMMETGEE